MAIQEYNREKDGSKICKISIDHDLCIGCGTCVSIDSETYEINDENKATVIDADATNDETLIMSAESCPARAISLTDLED